MSPNDRPSSLSVRALQFMLTARDLAVITSIRQWRFLTTRQICSLHFSEHASYASGVRACTRVLSRLAEHRLIYRLARPVGGVGGGSTSYVWGVDAAGDRLLRADPDSGFTKRFRPYEPTPLFLDHTLAVADVHVRVDAMRRAGELELIDVQPEPTSWRPFSWAGRHQVLKPDLYLVTAQGDDEWHRYIEVDRSTESIQQVLVEKKAKAYEEYAATGVDESILGIVPQVLWLVPDATRARRFRKALDAAKGVTGALHRIITEAELEAELRGVMTAEATLPTPSGGLA